MAVFAAAASAYTDKLTYRLQLRTKSGVVQTLQRSTKYILQEYISVYHGQQQQQVDVYV